MRSEWYYKIVLLVNKHGLGYLHNPGGGQFTHQGTHDFNCQILTYDDKEDYFTLLKALKDKGWE